MSIVLAWPITHNLRIWEVAKSTSFWARYIQHTHGKASCPFLFLFIWRTARLGLLSKLNDWKHTHQLKFDCGVSSTSQVSITHFLAALPSCMVEYYISHKAKRKKIKLTLHHHLEYLGNHNLPPKNKTILKRYVSLNQSILKLRLFTSV